MALCVCVNIPLLLCLVNIPLLLAKGVFQASPVDADIDLADLDSKILVRKHRMLTLGTLKGSVLITAMWWSA